MLFKLPQHKQFDYKPLFYKPEEDPEVKRKKRIHFRRPPSGIRSSFNRSILLLVILLAAVLYVINWVVKKF